MSITALLVLHFHPSFSPYFACCAYRACLPTVPFCLPICPPRWFHEMSITALLVLQLVTLAPCTHRTVAGLLLPNQRPGMGVLLWAAGGQPSRAYLNSDPEAVSDPCMPCTQASCPEWIAVCTNPFPIGMQAAAALQVAGRQSHGNAG